MTNSSPWGEQESKFFYELRPDNVLSAVESLGFVCTGKVLALNSMENRVYDVEIEPKEQAKTKYDTSKIVKFYRPGRWNKEQILEEHEFLFDLSNVEIPVVTPVLIDKQSLFKEESSRIYFSVFEKIGGRNPDEPSSEELIQIGRLLGRIHSVGAAKDFKHRIRLTPESYGESNYSHLIQNNALPFELENRFKDACGKLIESTKTLFTNLKFQRIHGDAHLGNLLYSQDGFFWVDFDDTVSAPPVQDLWLLLGDTVENSKEKLDNILEGYEQFHTFDYSSLKIVESLRSLRILHFAAWIHKRWEDESFKRAFPDFGSHLYWEELIRNICF